MVRYTFQVIVTIHVFAKYCVIIEAHIGMMQGTQTTTKQTYNFEEMHEKEKKTILGIETQSSLIGHMIEEETNLVIPTRMTSI